MKTNDRFDCVYIWYLLRCRIPNIYTLPTDGTENSSISTLISLNANLLSESKYKNKQILAICMIEIGVY